ncbi:MAG: tRNA 2-thiocytidine(32) synthetase TtcA [Ruminococcus sp.]|jgi:tRNA(Ile)-lysidine synthase TilS/MesJ|nr:tRNA 2-thiocytidine(32) synthetase TtcA [Ruminococcus sp.]
MQKILSKMRKAITDYAMIENGDSIAVGVSGGKDSLVLLRGLFLLQRFIGIDFSLTALTADMRFGGKPGDFSGVANFCAEMGIPYIVVLTDIAEIVFDIRKEPNPCSLCAKMRRGVLHEAAIKAGCNKIALGHSFDDTVETFIMNLFNEGRIGCYAPVTYLSRRDITLIRPLVYTEERQIRNTALRLGFPIVKSPCPEDGHTSREDVKQFLAEKTKTDKGFKDRMFTALKKSHVNGW